MPKVKASDLPTKAKPSVDLTPPSPQTAKAGPRDGNYWYLASPTGELTGQCVADLLKMVVAGNPSVCIADTSATATPYMLETGCLKLARTSAEIILLPLNVFSDHWTLVVIPLTGYRPISLFDSLKAPTRADAAKLMVADFLKQLAANWPLSADGGRRLPAGLTRNPPLIVTRAGPVQHNVYDCGVYIVMAAMFIVTGSQLPKSCHLGLWRRLFCLRLSLEPRRHPPAPRIDDYVSCLLRIDHADWNNVDPRGYIANPPARPREPAAWTGRALQQHLDQVKSYSQQLEKYNAEFKARRVESARRLEETLADMVWVLDALRGRAAGTAYGDGAASHNIKDFAHAVVQQAMVWVGKLVCPDDTEVGS